MTVSGKTQISLREPVSNSRYDQDTIKLYEKIGGGRQKDVFTVNYPDVGSKAYYVAVGNLFSSEKSLKNEYKTICRLKNRLLDIYDTELINEFLALDVVEIEKGIGDDYTLEVKRAKRDLEKELSDKSVKFSCRYEHALRILKAVSLVHSVGFVVGDVKASNFLIYSNGQLKLSDFGKCQELGDKTAFYSGNTRFAPPEGRMSKKGDVYGVALVLIRIFEELLLNNKETMLLAVKKNDKDHKSTNIRGIEKYMVEHSDFIGCESQRGVIRTLRSLKRRVALIWSTKQRRLKCRRLLNRYIYQFGYKFKQKYRKTIFRYWSESFSSSFVDLLIKMTNPSPNHRLSIQTSLDIFKKIPKS